MGRDVIGFLNFLKSEFSKNDIWWAFFAGFAVKNYAPQCQRNVTDIDILCEKSEFPKAMGLLEGFSHGHIITSKSIFNLELVDFRLSTEVELVGYIEILKTNKKFAFLPDEEMKETCRFMKVAGSEMPFLSPEDIIAFKMVSARGKSVGKQDMEDVALLFSNISIDKDYILRRAARMGALDIVMERLNEISNSG